MLSCGRSSIADSFKERIAAFPESFLVAEVDGTLIGYINGCATDSPVIYDELFIAPPTTTRMAKT